MIEIKKPIVGIRLGNMICNQIVIFVSQAVIEIDIFSISLFMANANDFEFRNALYDYHKSDK